MLKILTKLKNIFRRPNQLKEENTKLLNLLIESSQINLALNSVIGKIHNECETIKQEALQILSAIAMKYGGELLLSKEFIDTIKNNTDLILKITREEGDALLLKLVKKEQATPKGDEVCCDK